MHETGFLRTAISAALAMAVAVPTAKAQDLLAVASDLARIEYEDARVRIVRLRIPEGAAVPLHDRPRRVTISLTANDVLVTRADGTTRRTQTAAGSVAWSEPATRKVTNLGSHIENIVVELKQADEPAEPVARPPKRPPADYLLEPRHKWVFENQYVRVFVVNIPPGKTTAFHRHAFDDLSVRVSGGLVSSQLDGQPWLSRVDYEPGTIAVSANASKPFTHRVRNHGTADYRVVVVQFLR